MLHELINLNHILKFSNKDLTQIISPGTYMQLEKILYLIIQIAI